MGDEEAIELWENALKEIKHRVPPANYRTWFEKTQGISLTRRKLIVGVPRQVTAEYISKNQMSMVNDALNETRGSPVDIEFMVMGNRGNNETTNR